ncbi:XdhC family protein [Thioclava atlantica]|uniref:Exported xanthine dehydrogenase/CoxI family protein n=1 Tax=Thioclava atlantica TaxID=1317124 RepID=A0A085TZT1_9RHOB|nr:XdhC family protein [Thioclava atlantica]KFE36228.1 exported xanthine dehydrogenase/CoxI family protein [Thioclava atlantica]
MDGSLTFERVAITSTLDLSELPLPVPGQLAALAILTRIEGASYRPLGAAMSLDCAGHLRGQLSAGCIDADIAHHLRKVAQENRPRRLRYGAGSPFADLPLPCGGALEVVVMPPPAETLQQSIEHARTKRREITLHVAPGPGQVSAAPGPETELSLHLRPEPRFAVFGAGPEAETFARLAQSAGYQTVLACPEPGEFRSVETHRLNRNAPLAGMEIDARTAAVLFFHDHEREIPILRALLDSPAYYIGAQGSRRAAQQRAERLSALGLAQEQIARIRGPVGLIARARDPKLLAVSVLAEALEAAQG